MKVNFVKMPGGMLSPYDDECADFMQGFKTGEVYPADIKRLRNPKFHRKAFAFFRFCYEYWCSNKDTEFLTDMRQFEVFRNNLTVLAGYKRSFYTISGSVRVEADSLSFGSMDDEQFKQCYCAIVNAAIHHLFKDDESIRNQLESFF